MPTLSQKMNSMDLSNEAIYNLLRKKLNGENDLFRLEKLEKFEGSEKIETAFLNGEENKQLFETNLVLESSSGIYLDGSIDDISK